MHAKIRIELEDGTALEGTANLQTKHDKAIPTSVKRIMLNKQKLGRKSDLPSCINSLKEQGFFEQNPIITTPELLKALHLKCNKRISAKHATRDLGRLVPQGHIQRDELPPAQGRPKGKQIWYLPDTDKKVVEQYKKDNGKQK